MISATKSLIPEDTTIAVDASGYDMALPSLLRAVNTAILPDEIHLHDGTKILNYLINNEEIPYRAVMQGGKPTLLIGEDGGVEELPVPYVPKERIIDKNGAGDVARGAFMLASLFNETFKDFAICQCLGDIFLSVQ